MAKKNKGKVKPPRSKGGGRIKPPNLAPMNYDNYPPVFGLQYLVSDYGIDRCEKDEKVAFAETLCRLGQIPWKDLYSSGRHGLGCEQIARNAIRPGIPRHITPDVSFIVFRFYKKAPMVGYRDKQIFHIIWLDRKFNVYPH